LPICLPAAKNREIKAVEQQQTSQDDQGIVAESPADLSPWSLKRLRPMHWTAGGAAASLFLMMAAFGTVDQSPFPPSTQPVERLLAPEVQVVGSADSADYVHEDRYQRGDTFAVLLGRLGVNAEDIDRLLADRSASAPLRALRPGTPVQAVTGAEGQFKSLSFLGARDRMLGVEAAPEGFHAFARDTVLGGNLAMKSGRIRSSLFAATDDAGVPDSVATQLADIFGGEVDFHRDLRRGDHFTVVYETQSLDGRPVRAGRVMAAEFVNQGKAYRAVWYQVPPASGQADVADAGDASRHSDGAYYTPEGHSLKKAFLRSPLEFSRITSGVEMRFHPILKQWKQHQGVDYGAPIGAHVKATSDGVVEFAGREGGYGNLIILQHSGAYSTRYAHLSGFASGIHKGARVSQGEVIGFVGQTGLATGPHLHYEFRINNIYRNPLTMVFPSAEPLRPEQLQAFRSTTAQLASRLDLLRDSNLASLE
jgi:murein DD-endopeptidase MepM/ murein hydrolase activator NlpD